MRNYSVYDLEKRDYIGEYLTSTEVKNMIGLPVGRVSLYCDNKTIYKERYVIDESSKPAMKELSILWDMRRKKLNPNAKHMR